MPLVMVLDYGVGLTIKAPANQDNNGKPLRLTAWYPTLSSTTKFLYQTGVLLIPKY